MKKSLISIVLKTAACLSLALLVAVSIMMASCNAKEPSDLGEDTGVPYYSLLY